MCHTWKISVQTWFYCWPQSNWISFSNERRILVFIQESYGKWRSDEKKTAHTYTRLAQCHSIPPGQIFKLIINISGELKINCLQCYEFGFGESPYVLRWLLPHRHIFYTQWSDWMHVYIPMNQTKRSRDEKNAMLLGMVDIEEPTIDAVVSATQWTQAHTMFIVIYIVK